MTQLAPHLVKEYPPVGVNTADHLQWDTQVQHVQVIGEHKSLLSSGQFPVDCMCSIHDHRPYQ